MALFSMKNIYLSLQTTTIITVFKNFSWFLFLVNICHGAKYAEYTGKVLLVGFDGFRWDYLNYVDTPNFDKIQAEGTKVPYINNVFTSITFPSMYTIVTGLYPESHGIVGYTMYDEVFNETWTHLNHDSKWYNDGEPIWVTAKRQGLRTGSYFWLGSEVTIRGFKPDISVKYNESHGFYERVDEVIRWFTEEDMDVVTLYFHEPDATGHNTGPAPKSPETKAEIRKADEVIGYLLNKMVENSLEDTINLIIASDHGMTECSLDEKLIRIYEYLPASYIKVIADEGAVANILPAEGKTQAVFNALKRAHPNMTVYYKENIPEKWHFNKHRRIHPIVAVADEGWLIVGNGTWSAPLAGMHGYDTDLMSMKPFFLAKGPNIRANYESPVFNQVDIYILMCELLGIEPSPNNGSLDIAGQMLRRHQYYVNIANSSKSEVQGTLIFSVLFIVYLVLYRYI